MYDDLTLGTVVDVKVDDKEFSIMIVAKNLNNDKGLHIDYMGVVYPYGYVRGTDFVYFNKDLIKSIIHKSEKDKAVLFLEKLTTVLEKEINAKKHISDRN